MGSFGIVEECCRRPPLHYQDLLKGSNFTDTWPMGSNNYCCGGGGAHQAGFMDKKLAYGRFKFDQVASTHAGVVIVPCHNCHPQFKQLCEEYQGSYETWHLWDLITKALVR